jgi:hypothetical protein
MRVRNCNRFTVPPASQSVLIGPERSGCGNLGSVYLEVWAIVCVARIQKTPLSGLRRKQELSICCFDSFHSKTLRGTSESNTTLPEATISSRGGISHRLESYRRKLEADCGKRSKKSRASSPTTISLRSTESANNWRGKSRSAMALPRIRCDRTSIRG